MHADQIVWFAVETRSSFMKAFRNVLLIGVSFIISSGCSSPDSTVGGPSDSVSPDGTLSGDASDDGQDVATTDAGPPPCKSDAFCDDGEVCTIDTCDSVSGQCVHTPWSGPCDDDDACTDGDKCSIGKCKSGKSKQCTDNDPCTADTCVAGECTHKALDESACDDGNACTTTDKCVNGVCSGTTKSCDDNNPCTVDSCSKSTGSCSNQQQDGALCDDGNVCTVGDICQAGKCATAQKVCNDGNPCTSDSCDPQLGCVFTDSQGGDSCEDSDPCTIGDKCINAACQPGPKKTCDDNNICSNDWCDKTTGDCQHAISGQIYCSDNDACTFQDVCLGTACKGTPKNCDDGNACTEDVCTAQGGCDHKASSGACDDGNPCSVGDTCKGGLCSGTLKTCDDNNICTTDSCSYVSGSCTYTPYNGNPCDDKNSCTVKDTCIQGQCFGDALVCDDQNPCTTEFCNQATGNCTVTLLSDNIQCSDSNNCTLGDTCKSGVCVGKSKNCDDGNPCTSDSCPPATGQCANKTVADGIACNDGSNCTTGDTCNGGSCVGITKNCDDNNKCTSDACDASNGKCKNEPFIPCVP